jgi:hypothetical protein
MPLDDEELGPDVQSSSIGREAVAISDNVEWHLYFIAPWRSGFSIPSQGDPGGRARTSRSAEKT